MTRLEMSHPLVFITAYLVVTAWGQNSALFVFLKRVCHGLCELNQHSFLVVLVLSTDL